MYDYDRHFNLSPLASKLRNPDDLYTSFVKLT